MSPIASLAALLALLAAAPPPTGGREPERAEYAVRWDPSEGGPATARDVLELLGEPGIPPEAFEVRYFDLPSPPGAPPDSTVILRSRRRGKAKAELRLKFRRSSPLSQPWGCPRGAPFRASEEIDYGFGSAGAPVRVYAYSCDLQTESPPAFLAATPKPCLARMERFAAKSVKIEEWTLPAGGRILEVSRAAANSERELSRFQELVARLRALGVRPLHQSKSELGSDCGRGDPPRPAGGHPEPN